MRKLQLASLMSIYLLLPIISSGNTLYLEDPLQTYPLKEYLYLLPPTDSFKNISINTVVANHNSFIPLTQVAFTPAPATPIWIKFDLKNQLPDGIRNEEWVLKLSLTFTDIEIYTSDNTPLPVGRSGFFTPISQRTFIPSTKGNYSKLRLLPNQNYTIYAKVICERKAIAPTFDLQLTNLQTFEQSLASKQRWTSFYMGFVMMMLVYNLLIFVFAKDRAFLYYIIYLFGVFIYAAYNSGDLADVVTPILFPNQPYLIYYFKLLLYCAIASYLFFLKTFLELKNTLPKWDKFLKGVALLALPCMILDGTIMTATNYSYNISDSVLITYAVIFVLTSFSIIPPIIKLPGNKRLFIIYGVLAMGISTLFTVGARIQSIDFSAFYLRVGSVIEIIIFSLGLAYRHIQNEKEQQRVQYELEKNKLLQNQEQLELQKVKDLNQFKSKLYTNITHEFRTPLTVIMGMADALKGNKKAKELIRRNSTNLLRLINQLLELAKAETGNLQLHNKPVELIQYLRYIVASFSSLADTKKVQLQFQTSLSSLSLSIDEEKLKHIVQNLISNAIKFTPEQGKIHLSMTTFYKKEQEFFQLIVRDNGIGINQKELPHIFERFYQATSNPPTASVGTGIGLSLTKELVELMGGTIVARSQIKMGSEFTITLPITRVEESLSTTTTIEILEPAFVIGTEQVEYIPNQKPIILVIEDNLDVFLYIQHCLEKDYNLHLAENGKIGIKMAKEIVPDIIISDVMMPEKNGYEVTAILKKNEKTSHIPIILLTAKVEQDDKLKGLQQGADAYLTKPFDKNELLIRLAKIIEAQNSLRAFYAEATLKDPIPHPAGAQAELAFLEKLNDFVDKNMDKADFSMANLSNFLNMSNVQVYRKVKSLTQQTPTQYIRNIRLNKALELLKNTTLNISEIAYQVGYTDPNYFSRTFHKEFGRTPSSFR